MSRVMMIVDITEEERVDWHLLCRKRGTTSAKAIGQIIKKVSKGYVSPPQPGDQLEFPFGG